ncbi:alpha-mannosidase [Diplodia corticola]|uniref:Alpha-mannosidase n=1 Tax=Diplodia corticola TaxID=236234 RepID=A0A1J9RUW1_9PEZI|nr:alpha-mannosidase [Diplodia corticola]OJD32207.1 alpha-mannosidase [Diplodia corticola]
MASSSKNQDKFQISNVPVVLEWQEEPQHGDDDDAYRHLGHTLPVTLDAKLDLANATASLKLRILLSLKGAAKRVPLYLFIDPPSIVSASASASASTPTAPLRPPVLDTLTRKHASSTPLSLTFTLTHPPSLIAPTPTPPTPLTGPSAAVLASLRAACRRTALTLHAPRDRVPAAYVAALSAHAKPGALSGVPRERASLYGGRGGSAVDWAAASSEDGWGERGDESPPSYDELGVLPEVEPVGTSVSGARAERAERARRKRAGTSPESADRCTPPRKKRAAAAAGEGGGGRKALAAPVVDGEKVAALLEVAGDGWNRGVDERVAMLSEQLEALRKVVGGGGRVVGAAAAAGDDASKVAAAPADTGDVCTRLARLEAEMAAVRADVAAANTRWEELAEQLREQAKEDMEKVRWSIVEDMEHLLARSRDEVVDEAECRMEDRFLSAKEELREAVEEECENAEGRIKELLSNGAAGVYFEFPK